MPRLTNSQIEQKIRDLLIDSMPDDSEIDYCRRSVEILEGVSTGLEMRLQELEAEEG